MSLTPAANFLTRVIEHATRAPVAVVTVSDTKGSAPREVGAAMAVLADGSYFGTIGGGALEHEAQVVARQLAAAGQATRRQIERALGPDLGQCCGGRVRLDITVFTGAEVPALQQHIEALAAHDPRQPVMLFGAGHVGRALVLALAPLPFTVDWIDSRDDAFPSHVPANATCVHAARPEEWVAQAHAGTMVLIMTHDHALDLAITAAALSRDDLRFIGLIGSATKRARFQRRIGELGLSSTRLVCPVGLPGITGKEPAVIAASVAAQLLGERMADQRVTAPLASLPAIEAAISL